MIHSTHYEEIQDIGLMSLTSSASGLHCASTDPIVFTASDTELTVQLSQEQIDSQVLLVDEERNIRLKADGHQEKVLMDVSNLPYGAYYLVVNGKGKRSVKRIIIN